jgi:hypothetical protein
MILVGISNGKKYLPVRGFHNGVPYLIVEDSGRFLLEQVRIQTAVGLLSGPIGFFDSSWEGVYKTDSEFKGERK